MAEALKDCVSNNNAIAADDEKGLVDLAAQDSGIGSSVASSDTSASNEHLQGSTNPTRIIHLHNNFSQHTRRLSSPTNRQSPSTPVQNFMRTSQVLDYDNFPIPQTQLQQPSTPVSALPSPPTSPTSPTSVTSPRKFSNATSTQATINSVKENNGEEPKTGQSWLLRLFESKMFDASMAVHYLFNSKEPGVLSYLGNRLFTLSDKDVEFYLPQLINMYVQHHEVAEVIHPYLVHRCRQSVDFSLQCAWLLEAYTPANSDNIAKRHRSHATKLKNLILTGDLVPKETSTSSSSNAPSSSAIAANGELTKKSGKQQQQLLMHHYTNHHSASKKTHMRSRSDASALIASGPPNLRFLHPHHIRNLSNAGLPGHVSTSSVIPLKRLTLGDLTSGRAFDNGCACFESCKAAVNELKGRKTYCKYLHSVEKLRIFQSLRFYVKLVLENVEVLNLPFIAIFGAFNFVNLGNYRLLKVQIFMKI